MDTRGATTEADDPVPTCSNSRALSVWYKYTPARDVPLFASAGGDVDLDQGFCGNTAICATPIISVWTGAPGSFTPVACNAADPFFWYAQAAVSFSAAGTTYYFMVSDAYGPPWGGLLAFLLDEDNPAPILTAISPTSVEAGGSDFTLTVDGSGFLPSSTVEWRAPGQPPWEFTVEPTTFVSDTRLTRTISASDIAIPGTKEVTVGNPSRGGHASSSPLSFAVTGFSIGLFPATSSVARGQVASFTVSVSPQLGPFDRAVNLSCSVAPVGPTCSLGNPNLTPGANPATTTLTVNTSSSASLRVPREAAPLWALWVGLPGLALLGVGLTGGSGRRKKLGLYASLGLVVAFLALQVACGGGAQRQLAGQRQPAGQLHTITVSSASGSVQAQGSASLTVQQ